jgi:hypothetical protein
MEYVEGESAKTRMKRKGRIEPLEAIAIAIHVATALEYGWRKAQLIHRDIKPDNIFLSSDGEVKLGDLGLAKSAGQTQGLTMTGHSMGTPHYISPEQVEAMKTVDLRADIYSLGCTLFHMLSGQVPFDGNSAVSIMMKHINGPVPKLKDAWPECPQVLNQLVGKMMQKDPAERQQDYAIVISDLREAYEVVSNQDAPTMEVATPAPVVHARSAVTVKAPESISSQNQTPGKSKAPIYAGIALGVLAIVFVAFFILRPKEENLTASQQWDRDHPGSTSSPAPEHGALRLWDSAAKLPLGSKARWENGAVRLDNGGLHFRDLTSRDVVFRASIRMNEDANSPNIDVRDSGDSVDQSIYYRVTITKRNTLGVDLSSVINNKLSLLRWWPLPRSYGPDEYLHLEVRAVADQLTVIADGKTLGTVQDTSVSEPGGVMIHANANGYFRDIVYVPLDKADNTRSTPSSVSPETATEDSPFVNSLGMKFVPVPGTKVLFSIWDTRVQDYAVYANEDNVDDAWKKQNRNGVPVSQKPDYPVVAVSWDDAQGFSRWLTRKEIAGGKLPNGAKYRLPTDEEWSLAVGLASEQGATPAEKNGRDSMSYPWGIGFPPSKQRVGNFADTAFHESFPTDQWIDGYSDGFATTSPVGSFSPNENGLYDTGGNVWQWCEDWYDMSQREHVLRGSSWADHLSGSLLLSDRHHTVVGTTYYGFRCVLELPQK